MDYNFPVDLQPVFLSNGKQIVNRQAVVRTDTMDTLGIVSNEYGLIKHATVIDSFREAGQEFGVQEKISLVSNGAKMFYQMTFPKVQMEIKKGDIVQMQMIVKNSYNGGNSLSVIFGALRLVCLNGMVLGTNFMQFRFRHIGNVGGLRNQDIIDEYKNAYSSYLRLFSEKVPVINRMAQVQVGESQMIFDKNEIKKVLFNKDEVKMPQYLLEEAETEFSNKNDLTVWGYYNALTYAVTHKMKKESPDRAIWYGMEAWKAAERVMN